MIIFQMIWKISETPELLQSQAHLWHFLMLTKHLENAGNHSPQDKRFEGGNDFRF